MSIQSITIPAHETRPFPKPHTSYCVTISTPVRTWSVWRRYSDFESLARELKAETGRDVDGEGLPGKHAWSLRSSINDTKLIEERRISLEAYLRHILSSKDGTHRASHAFLDFLGAPPLPASTRNATAASSSSTAYSSSVPPPPTTFTSPAWLSEHANLLTLSRSIRSSLSKRDTLLGSGNTSGGHIAGIQAKRELQELVSRVGALALGLEEISKRERLGDGEMRRRNDLVAKLQDECVGLGKQAATARRAAVAQERSDATTGSSFFQDAPPTAQRAALLGLGGGGGGGGGGAGEVRTVRTFGAPPPGRETDETRPLDAGGLMHLQQTRINEQDTMLGQLSAILQRQRIIGEAIGQEITEQNELLDKLDQEVDQTGAKMGKAKREMNRLK